LLETGSEGSRANWAYKVGAGARRKIPPNNSAKIFHAYLGGHGFLRYFIISDRYLRTTP
jgi:hypothetical protein